MSQRLTKGRAKPYLHSLTFATPVIAYLSVVARLLTIFVVWCNLGGASQTDKVVPKAILSSDPLG